MICLLRLQAFTQGEDKTWTPGPWTTSLDWVHGPPLWTGSMDHLFGPGPWTPYFSSLQKMEKRKKKRREGTPRISHRCCFHRENIDSIIKVTGQTRLPLAAKSIKKPLE